MFSKLNTLFHTLIHLKPTQAIYQVKNRLIKAGSLSTFELAYDSSKKIDFFPASAINQGLKVESNQIRFEFLNHFKSFHLASIDWNDQSHGKLWNYNLQYLDFLKQEEISVETKISLLKSIYTWLWTGKLPLEPYPVSLRIMNMIRFLESNQIPENEVQELKKYVLAEVNYLSQNLEYHLLANHLLENAFAWWMGALYFQNEGWILKSQKLLLEQLEEQILSDGAHYELAPMYHQIIFFRVLEAYYLTPDSFSVKKLLKTKAELMLGWLNRITFPNGTLPHFNDTTEGIAYSSAELQEMAFAISLVSKNITLSDSGYRSLEFQDLKLIADIEGIKPTYQPGHAHADTFSFVMHLGMIPVIVDPGISTYNISPRRDWERSTIAHNTVTIEQKNSSQVWSGFRVGKRAKVKVLEDSEQSIIAEHDGFGIQKHQRTFKLEESGIQIIDKILNSKESSLFEMRLYLHPNIQAQIIQSKQVLLRDNLMLQLQGARTLEICDYEYCLGYNQLIAAKYLRIEFEGDFLISTFLPLS